MSKRRIVATLVVGLIVTTAVVAQFAIVGAAGPGPVPSTSNPVTLTASPVTNLTSGQTVTFTVTTGGTAKLVGNLSAHLCIHGFASYSTGTFGYSGSSASRCVYSTGIVSGGLTGGDYEKVFGPYSGADTTSGSLTFKVATGTVTWGNDTGFGPFTLTASSTSPVDLVIQVNLVGDTTPVTYFIQPLSFAGSSTTTTSSTSTTSSSTTTTTTTTSTTTTTVPTSNAVGSCSGVQFLGAIVPPLPASGAPTSTVAALKSAKPGLVVWGPGFGSQVVTTGASTCTILGVGYGDVTVSAKLSGVASCRSASTDPTLYPLNGKLKLSYANKTLSSQAYVRVAGYDPVPGPDVIALTGMIVKGRGVGATLSGEVFFDPVVKALVNGEGGATPGSSPVLKGQYYFDSSQLSAACGTAGSKAIGLIYGGDGSSLLGSGASGLTFGF